MNFMEFIRTCTVKHGTCCSKSPWWTPKPVSLLFICLNHHMSKHTISAAVMPQIAWNRSALNYVLTQGPSERDITVFVPHVTLKCISWDLINNKSNWIKSLLDSTAQQTITWSKVDACVWHHDVLQGHNELKWGIIKHLFHTIIRKSRNKMPFHCLKHLV